MNLNIILRPHTKQESRLCMTFQIKFEKISWKKRDLINLTFDKTMTNMKYSSFVSLTCGTVNTTNILLFFVKATNNLLDNFMNRNLKFEKEYKQKSHRNLNILDDGFKSIPDN